MIKVALTLAVAASAIVCMVVSAWIMPHPSSSYVPRNSDTPMVDTDGDGIREADELHGVRVEENSPLWDCRTMGNLVCGTTYYGG